MSTDVAIYDEELKSLEDDIAACLRACDSLGGDARQEKLNKAADLVKKIGKVYHQYKYELRMLEGSEQAIYEKKASEHQASIQKLKGLLTTKRAEASSAGGGGGGSGGSPNGNGGGNGNDADERRNDGKDDARQSTKRIGKIQDNTLDSLKRTAGMVDESENLGNEAATTLSKQTGQMKENLEKLEVIEGQVDKAKKELNAFIRRMMTDKIILCFAILIVIGIIAVVALKLTKKDDAPAPTASPAPPTPVPTPPPTPVPTPPPTPQPTQNNGGGGGGKMNVLALAMKGYYKS